MYNVFEELNKLYESKEFKILYRLTNWPTGETTTAYLYADSAADAEELFMEYMLDPEAYDDGDTPLTEKDIEIIKISK